MSVPYDNRAKLKRKTIALLYFLGIENGELVVAQWPDSGVRHLDLMATSNFDIFAVCESWLNDTVLDSEIAIEGYQVYRKDRSNSIGGGVCVYVKNEYACTVCHYLMFNDVEALWGVLNLDSKKAINICDLPTPIQRVFLL